MIFTDNYFNLFEGLYSCGKSHILRLAVPIQCIIEFCNTTVEETVTPDNNAPENGEISSDSGPESQITDETEHNSSTQHNDESMPNTTVTAEAINVACSIVRSCLAQICK